MPDSFGRLGSAALINSNSQQITILPACNRSEGEVGSAKSFSLSDLGHEILPETKAVVNANTDFNKRHRGVLIEMLTSTYSH